MIEEFKSILDKEILSLFEITKILYLNPEVGNQEFKSSKLLVNYLNEKGFITTYPYILPTGFLAVYKSNKKGPKIGYLCEYDALPLIGHGCGHNLICTISIGAALCLKSVVDKIGGEIYVFGTPAEENFGGKVSFAKEGAFDNIDMACMLHPSNKNSLGSRSNALVPIRFKFKGKSAHACTPYNGASALDSAVMTYQGINMLRQFAKQPSFIHGIISDGGKAANIIPEYASLDYYFRSDNIKYANFLASRAKDIATSCASMNNCSVTFEKYETAYDDTKINYSLSSMLKNIYEQIGLTDIKDVDEIPSGSTDVGAVSKIIPTIQGYIKITDESINAHSTEFAAATISNDGYNALYNGALALGLLGYKYIINDSFKEEVKKEFNKL